MNRLLGLKIDVDTYLGMQKGVPSLLKILQEFGVKGTFYLSIGPDASGRAILQVLRNPLFLKKMLRTHAIGLYGLRTALYGTLLPSPMIALSFPGMVQDILFQGHEVQFHAWDHRRWQDELPRRTAAWIGEWFARGVAGFEALTHFKPTSFGAPGWLIDDRVLGIIKEYHFEYLSCTRAKEAFIHEGCNIVEIPSDLPCIEEVGREGGMKMILELLKTGDIHVLPVHAEVEGGLWQDYFTQLLGMIRGTDYLFVPLREIYEALPREALTARKYRLDLLPGRATPCAV